MSNGQTPPGQVGGRFVFKLWFAILIASFGTGPFLVSLSGCLALLGTATAMVALLRRERFQFGVLTHWDEVLWLTAASVGLMILHRIFAI